MVFYFSPSSCHLLPKALHQLESFRPLFLLQAATQEELEYLHLLCQRPLWGGRPTTYAAWAALMGWVLTLTRKLTGER